MLSNKIFCAAFSPRQPPLKHESADEDNDIGNCCFYFFPYRDLRIKKASERETKGKSWENIAAHYLRLCENFLSASSSSSRFYGDDLVNSDGVFMRELLSEDEINSSCVSGLNFSLLLHRVDWTEL